MSRGWSGLGLLYRLLEGSWVDCGEVEEEEVEEVTRDKVVGLELAALGPSRRELAELHIGGSLVEFAVGCAVDLFVGFSWCRQVLDPSLHVEHWLSE